MQSALYVGLSAQVALEKRLQTIANNVANVNTAAFRTDVVKFETVLSKAGANPVAFSSPGDNIISREMGSITESGNPLDVAVVGQGWIAFAGPNGTVYTRDGRLQIAANGDLQTVSGFPVIDSGGAQITLDPNGGPVSIARSGAITRTTTRSAPSACSTFPPTPISTATAIRASRPTGLRPRSPTSPATASSRAMSKARAPIR